MSSTCNTPDTMPLFMIPTPSQPVASIFCKAMSSVSSPSTHPREGISSAIEDKGSRKLWACIAYSRKERRLNTRNSLKSPKDAVDLFTTTYLATLKASNASRIVQSCSTLFGLSEGRSRTGVEMRASIYWGASGSSLQLSIQFRNCDVLPFDSTSRNDQDIVISLQTFFCIKYNCSDITPKIFFDLYSILLDFIRGSEYQCRQ